MSTNANETVHQEQQGSSLQAALARTATRSIALYFSRPVRLFRPSKVSGWHSLRGYANKHGETLSAQYMTSLVKNQGFVIIPKHFMPPMLVNALLGTVLWTTYSECSNLLEQLLDAHPMCVAALSGAAAGGMQALAAAPAENVRLIIDGGSSWSTAWKEVFRGTAMSSTTITRDQIKEIRQVRLWMREVSSMAGRGWDGWAWGCAKDACGFAAFFAIFELTRRVAANTKAIAQSSLQILRSDGDTEQSLIRHIPRAAHAVALVSGGAFAGLTYELLSRPWDAARRAVQLDRALHSQRSPTWAVIAKVREEGFISLFRDPTIPSRTPSDLLSPGRRRIYAGLRTLGRVGPWGMGFLVWESFGPGIS
ncbi:hypothetical protein BJ138DRAFT_1155713 [Hygrophoropsis aurantiaca]|uniref:Uncharacterized protein n=1 Tax=Hygrophoropsis aurantiaca TaxID=72124 RepID=A0ACB8A7L6_9AGAM|nr:hypothetical protein BJ138DRAFT_1155713 [Hygrophoropsis aurantiaca]